LFLFPVGERPVLPKNSSPMPDTSSSLPSEIVQAISIANATSIGAQPAILANLALANQIFNNSLQQQAQISTQRAIDLLTLAIVARGVSLIASDTSGGGDNTARLQELVTLLKTLAPAPHAAAAS